MACLIPYLILMVQITCCSVKKDIYLTLNSTWWKPDAFHRSMWKYSSLTDLPVGHLHAELHADNQSMAFWGRNKCILMQPPPLTDCRIWNDCEGFLFKKKVQIFIHINNLNNVSLALFYHYNYSRALLTDAARSMPTKDDKALEYIIILFRGIVCGKTWLGQLLLLL